MSSSQSLSVPEVPKASSRHTTSRSSSASSVQRIIVPIDALQDLNSQARPRADTGTASRTVGEERPTKIALPSQKIENAGDLRSGLASPMMPDGAVQMLIASIHDDNPNDKTPSLDQIPQTTFYAGPSHKAFRAHNHLLAKKVPFFTKLLSSKTPPTKEQLTFETLDEFAAAIFIRWLYGGELNGPVDFHSMHHYLALYVLAFTWDIEQLCNTVMDLVRHYYRRQCMTAPAFRLEYIYTMTAQPNYMRSFLVQTVAYRALCESPPAKGVYLSESIKGVLKKSADLVIDFPEALIKLSRNDVADPRKGENCSWHEHSDGKVCKPSVAEPYE